MNGVTIPVVKAWFDAYKDLLIRMKIEEKNIYNMDKTGFSIGTMDST
jgi:hemoglobin-like flavoprotein